MHQVLLMGDLAPYVKHTKNLGVIFYSALKFDKTGNCCSYKLFFFQLRFFSKAKILLAFVEFERVIHVFNSSRLDYCNSLYIEMSQKFVIFRWFKMQPPYFSPILHSLHWLPIC